ncbi:nucleoside deaminase [Taibaiella chishuiensis]|uniref:tRNA(Arg) A34 adenosine deaminase TadA n=1 Tax=Taibaiella chishuiensis TaxID=1434707 RepID=A0A2P8D082_9BACT|nr:nucleoside deaminase [Taibaiella chishuiensis]PSK90633.1 tRNA(Arg) A34 adenosine deaminase TadA [Taibaiella chishuiensis]
MEEKFMDEAVRLSRTYMERGQGGPFGCVIVKDGQVVGRGWNDVLHSGDPTAHAEVNAIRDACKNLDTHQLEGCELYASCEPCPMCLGAIYWARPDKVYFANTREDAAAIGFDDAFIYEEINRDPAQRKISMVALDKTNAMEVFRLWTEKKDKVTY